MKNSRFPYVPHWFGCMALLAVLLLANSLRADDDDDRRRRRNVPFPAVNPAHEQTKQRAESAYTNGDFQQVVELMDPLLRVAPQDDVALYLRGSARIELGIAKGDAALIRSGIADSRNAILHDKKSQSMYYLPYLYGMTNLAGLEDRDQHAEVSDQVATQVLQKPNLKGEERANILYQRALARQSMKKFDEAAADYQAAITAHPQHLGAQVALAEAYVAAGKTEQARAAFDSAIAAFPGNALVYNNRGMFLQQQGQLDESIRDFTRALEEDPNYHYSYTNRGYSLMELGSPEAAEGDYTQALERNANQPMVYSLRAAARLAQGKAAEAATDYRKVLELEPKNAAAWADLGFAQYFSGDYANAYESLTQASTIDAELRYVNPWRYLSLTAAGQSAQAESLFAESLAKTADQKDWLDRLIAFQAGKLDLDGLKQGISADDKQMQQAQECEWRYFAGQKSLQSGNAEEANEYFRAALETQQRHLSAYKGAQFALKTFQTAAASDSE